ncbi:DUF397 domain-containing protein [Streptomyces sp. NPDC059479]|uniref:DUF397 domain-containing protein n=1 Tax=Streptomyces sp. NPDC059479 TaxID=3346848 RepID=UPI003683A41B
MIAFCSTTELHWGYRADTPPALTSSCIAPPLESTYSSGSGTECVEAALLVGGVVVRDSKDPGRGRLVFGRDAWGGFVGGVVRGMGG